MNAVTSAPLSGEILGPAEFVGVIAVMHPLKRGHELVMVPIGSSIEEIVEACARQCGVSRLAKTAHVALSGHVIPPEVWHRVRIKSGAHIVVRAAPGKGLGNIFRSILSIALAVVAGFVVGPAGLGIATALGGGVVGSFAASAVAGAIMIGGNLLISALFPPSQTKSSDETNPSYSISAQKNGAAKWGPIPVMLGNARVHPKYAAGSYTEFVGDDQYLRMLFCWGYGPLPISDIRIGDTPLDEYDDVEVQTFEGYPDDGKQTLYPSEVVQDDLNIAVTQADGPFVRSSAEDGDEIVIDLIAPQGIVDINTSNGDRGSYSVDIKVELRRTGSTDDWTDARTITFTGKSNDPIRKSIRITDLDGQWDVRLTRLTKDVEDSGSTGIYSAITWSALKTFRASPPIEFSKPLAITALRIRASKQLNGTIDNLNGIASTVAKSWNGTEWVEQETRNPGDLFRLVLQGPANARRQPDTRLDLPTIEAFADHCRSKGFTFDMYRDFTASVRDTLKDICAAGRGVPTFRDGKWSVAWEEADAPIVQHFTPRNSRDFTWTQTYRTFPHGLRCKFVNRNKDYVEDEMLVFDDGWDKTNATLYEQAEFPGDTDPDLIYKHARYRIAEAKARPAGYKLTTDFEHLIAQRGDRVVAAHDVIEVGIAYGRIQAVDEQQLTLDEPAVMEAGKSYGLRVRRRDGSSVVLTVTTDPGVQSVVTFAGQAPEVGDLYTFGLRGQETGTYRILAIKPGDDLSAEIQLVDDGNDVQSGDDATDIPGGANTAPLPLSTYKPRNLRLVQSTVSSAGGAERIARLYWDMLFGPNVQSFEAIATDADGTIKRVAVGAAELHADFINLAEGQWTFRARALVAGNRSTGFSDPVVATISTIDEPMPFVSDLALFGGTTATEFTGTDPEFVWTNNWPGYQAVPSGRAPLYAGNYVKVYDVATNDLLRTDHVEQPAYTYSLALNRSDNAKFGRGASRTIRVEVAVEDIFGRVSDYVALTVDNPPPPAIAPTVTPAFGSLYITWTLPDVPDLAGVAVWLSTVSGFDPATTPPAYDGLNTVTNLPALPETDYFLRIGAYDTFGRGVMNISGEMTVRSLSPEVDTEAPAVPAGLDLSQRQVVNPDGSTTWFLTATWDANSEADFAYYVVRLKEGAGNFIAFSTAENSYEWRVTAGLTYQVNLRAVDTSGNRSNLCSTKTKTITGDTTAPAVPANPKATPGFQTIWLEWEPVAETDLDHYEVYESASAVAPTAATAGTYKTAATTLVHSGLGNGVKLYYWVAAVDISGNRSAWSTGTSATTVDLTSVDLDAAIADTEYAKALAAPLIVTELPALPSPVKRVYYQAAIWKQKADGSGWIKESDASQIVGQLVAGQIAAGAVGVDQLAARSVATSKMLVADMSNMVKNPDLPNGSADNWVGSADVGGPYADASTPYAFVFPADDGEYVWRDQAVSEHHSPYDDIAISPGQSYFVSANVFAEGLDGSGDGSFELGFLLYKADLSGADTPQAVVPITPSAASVEEVKSGIITIPDDPTIAYGRIRIYRSGGTSGHLFRASKLTVRRAADAELIVDGAVRARHLDTENAVITGTAQIANAVITSEKVVDLDAEKLRAGSALAGSLTISGNPLSTIAGNAMDPAAQINRGTTQILPGNVVVSGASTLLDVLGSWAYGGDYTQIDGGRVAANTLEANSAVFGVRGIQVEGLQFESNSPSFNSVSWTAGTIRYVGDDGNIINRSIPADAKSRSSGTLYIYYRKGSSNLDWTYDVATALSPDCVVLAAYLGDTDLVTDYGRTVIDGGHIKSIMAAFQTADIQSLSAAILVAKAIKGEMVDVDDLLATTALITKLTADEAFIDQARANLFVTKKLQASEAVITGGGNIINFDPHFTDMDYWLSKDSSLYSVAASRYNSSLMIRTVSSASIYWDDKTWPIDPDKDYELDVVVDNGGDGLVYVAWKFYDYAGNLITTAAEGNLGSGWPSVHGESGRHYFPAAYQGTANGAYHYEQFNGTIGPNGDMTFPDGACFCSLGWLANYNAANPDHCTLAHAYMKERVNGELVVHGTIITDHLIVNAVSGTTSGVHNSAVDLFTGWTTLVDCSMTVDDAADFLIVANTTIEGSSTSGSAIAIYVDGSYYNSITLESGQEAINLNGTNIIVHRGDRVVPLQTALHLQEGSHTILLRAHRTQTSETASLINSSLAVLSLKR